MIPRTIHQTWKTAEIPARWRRYQADWKRLHPEWEYRFWTDEDNSRLVAEDYPDFLDLYESYEYPVLRSDLARIMYLHRFGGLYADLDLEPLKCLDPLVERARVVLGVETGGMGRVLNARDYVINACMASPKGHPFWEMLLDRLLSAFRPRKLLEPREHYVIRVMIFELDRLVREYSRGRGDIVVHPAGVFYPTPWFHTDPESGRRIAAEKDSYTIHHYDTSWFSPGMAWVKRVLSSMARRSPSPSR